MEITSTDRFGVAAPIPVPAEEPPFCQELCDRGLWPTGDLPAALLQLLEGDESPTSETSWCSRLCALTDEELSRPEFDGFFRELGHELEYFPRQTLWKMRVAFQTRFVPELRQWGDETVSARLCLERWHPGVPSQKLKPLVFYLARLGSEKVRRLKGPAEKPLLVFATDVCHAVGFAGLDHGVYRAVIDGRHLSSEELFEVVAAADDVDVKVAPLGYCFYTAVRGGCPPHLQVEKAAPVLNEGIWARIVRFLSPGDIRSLLDVSQRFRCEVNRPWVWQAICQPDTEESAEGFFSWHKGKEKLALAMAARIQRDPFIEHHPSRGRCVQLYELICTSEAALAQFREALLGPGGEFAPALGMADVPRALGQFLAGIRLRCGEDQERWDKQGYDGGRLEFDLQYGIPVVGDTSFRDVVVPLLKREDAEASELLAEQVRRLGRAHFRVGGAALRTHRLAQLSDAELVALVKRHPDSFAVNSIMGTLIERFRTGGERDLFGALPSLIAEVPKPPATEGGVSLAWVSDAMDEMTHLFEEVMAREGELTAEEAIQLAKLSGWILSKDTNHWLKLFRGARLAHPSDCPILAYRALEMGLHTDSEEMVRVRAWLYVSRALDVRRTLADSVRTQQDRVLDSEQLSQWLPGQAHLAPQLDNSRAFLQACKEDGRISKDVADRLLALLGE